MYGDTHTYTENKLDAFTVLAQHNVYSLIHMTTDPKQDKLNKNKQPHINNVTNMSTRGNMKHIMRVCTKSTTLW